MNGKATFLVSIFIDSVQSFFRDKLRVKIIAIHEEQRRKIKKIVKFLLGNKFQPKVFPWQLCARERDIAISGVVTRQNEKARRRRAASLCEFLETSLFLHTSSSKNITERVGV